MNVFFYRFLSVTAEVDPKAVEMIADKLFESLEPGFSQQAIFCACFIGEIH